MSRVVTSEVNIKELEGVLTHMIDNNKVIQAKGQVPVAINVVGPAGLGKTSVIQQVGLKMGFKPQNIVKLSLATLEDIGDLIGFPLTEFKMAKQVGTDDKNNPVHTALWVKEKAMDEYKAKGYFVVNESRMAYSAPDWIAGKTGGGVLILDDYTRASQRFTQAVMEVIETQKYATWELPKGWTVILSSNPDDGTYNVTDQDPAQRSRYMNIHLKFDNELWAEWAEKNDIDSRCINFTLMNPELIKPEAPEINARSITKFYNAISSIENFAADQSLHLIQLLGEGSLGVEATTMFTSFIRNNMDKIITTQEILDASTPFKKIEETIQKLVKSKDKYRGDIAYVICSRLITYAQFKLNDDNTTPEMVDRVEELLGSDVLGTDLKFVLGKKITNLDCSAFNRLLVSDAVLDNILD